MEDIIFFVFFMQTFPSLLLIFHYVSQSAHPSQLSDLVLPRSPAQERAPGCFQAACGSRVGSQPSRGWQWTCSRATHAEGGIFSRQNTGNFWRWSVTGTYILVPLPCIALPDGYLRNRVLGFFDVLLKVCPIPSPF